MVRVVRVSKILNTFVVASTRQGILISSLGYTDSAQTTDAINSFHFNKGLNDSVVTSDYFAILASQDVIVADGINPTDALDGVGDLPTYTFGKTLADAISATDSFGSYALQGRAPADGFSLADVLAKVMGFNRAHTDSATATEAPLLATGLVKADTLTSSEVSVYTFGKTLSETLTITDSVNSFARGLPLADGATPVDLVSVPDGSTYTLNKSLSNAAAASDVFSRQSAFARGFTDSATLGDVFSRQSAFARGFTDSAATSDAAVVSLAIVRSLADAFSLTDSINSKILGGQRDLDPDSASVSDTILVSQGWARIVSDDSASAIDDLQRVVAYKPALADAITPAEASVLTFGMTLADSATIVDLIGVPDKSTYTLGMNERDSISSPTDIATFAVGAAYSDIILMDSDAAVFTTGMVKSDSATPGELASLGTFKVFTDSVSAIDNEDSSGFSLGSGNDPADTVGTGDSASGSMQSYFAAEYVSFTEVYVQDSRHDI
tara:strand:+ start:208 stop:1692 length:1485 start_codon:yes stop_codon:yes gene_type:complete